MSCRPKRNRDNKGREGLAFGMLFYRENSAKDWDGKKRNESLYSRNGWWRWLEGMEKSSDDQW